MLIGDTDLHWLPCRWSLSYHARHHSAHTILNKMVSRWIGLNHVLNKLLVYVRLCSPQCWTAIQMLLCVASSLLHNRLDGFLFDKDISSYDSYSIVSSCTLSIYSWSYMSKHLLSISRSDWYLALSPCELLLSTTLSYSAYIFSSTSFTTTYSSQLIIHVIQPRCWHTSLHNFCQCWKRFAWIVTIDRRQYLASFLCYFGPRFSAWDSRVDKRSLLKAHATYHSRSVSIGTSIARR